MKVLTKRQILLLHSALIRQSGGSDGIRDEGLLDSAVSTPFQTFADQELYPSLLEKAARLGMEHSRFTNPSGLNEEGHHSTAADMARLARAVLEHCADRRRLGAKTLFATHYHELTELEGSVKGVRNYYISARKQGGNLIFLRKIIRGSVDESYGIEVAKLAGVPDSVITRARECLDELLESARAVPVRSSAPAPQPELQLSLADTASDEVLDRLRSAALDTMSPIEAMNLLYELKRKLDT